MSDYIKREDAIDYLTTNMNWFDADGIETSEEEKRADITELVNGVPSADVAPIRYGKWVEDYNEQEPAGFKLRWRCTECDNWQTYGQTFFCPYCGARMIDGGGTDADRID